MKNFFYFVGTFFLVSFLLLCVGSDTLSKNLSFYVAPFDSMAPEINMRDGIAVVLNAYATAMPERGDVIIFISPFDSKKTFVKRIVGLPGDSVEIKDRKIYINGEQLISEKFPLDRYYSNSNKWDYAKEGQIMHVPKDTYYVLGDNTSHSSDSRQWGFVPKQNIVGKAVFVYWPVWRWHFIK